MDSPIKSIFAMVIFKVLFTNPAMPPRLQQCIDRGATITIAPYNCCVIPDLISSESIATCGEITDEHSNNPALRGSADCVQSTCVLRNNDLLFSNDEIDNESVKQFLDEFAQKYRKYIPAVDAVKERCASGKVLFGLPQWCEADKFFVCVKNTFWDKCPDWLNTDECIALRSHLEDCVPYFSNATTNESYLQSFY